MNETFPKHFNFRKLRATQSESKYCPKKLTNCFDYKQSFWLRNDLVTNESIILAIFI